MGRNMVGSRQTTRTIPQEYGQKTTKRLQEESWKNDYRKVTDKKTTEYGRNTGIRCKIHVQHSP